MTTITITLEASLISLFACNQVGYNALGIGVRNTWRVSRTFRGLDDQLKARHNE